MERRTSPAPAPATATFAEYAGTEVEHLGEDVFVALHETLTCTLTKPSNAKRLRDFLASTQTRRHPRLPFAEEVICICVEFCRAVHLPETSNFARNRAKRMRTAGATAIRALRLGNFSDDTIATIAARLDEDTTVWDWDPGEPTEKLFPAQKFYTEAQRRVRDVLLAAGVEPKLRAREYAAKIVGRMLGLALPDEVQSKLAQVKRGQYVNWYVGTLLSIEPKLRHEHEKLSAALQVRAKALPSRLIELRRTSPKPTDAELAALRERLDAEAGQVMQRLLDLQPLAERDEEHLRDELRADRHALQREVTALRQTPKP